MTSAKRLGISATVLVVALLGAAIAGYLTYRHYEVLSGRFDKPSFCSWSRTVDCDAVATSKYAEVAGWPVSTAGLMYYAVIAALACGAMWSRERLSRAFLGTIVLFSGLALFLDLGLAGILAFRIKVLCLLCVLTYAVNLVIFMTAFFAAFGKPRWRTLFGDLPALAAGENFVQLAGVVFLVFVVMGASVYLDRKWKKAMQPNTGAISKEQLRAQIKSWFESQPKIKDGVDLYSSGPMQGSPTAKMMIADFSDFECPHCKRAAGLIRPFLNANRQNVRFYYKQYPLDQACNPKITHSMHKRACLFAAATLCAREQPPRDMFWDMHDIVFDKNDTLTEEGVVEEAKKLGLAEKPFRQCLKAESTQRKIHDDIELGDKVDVHSTPTMVVNGRVLTQGTLSPEVWQVILEIVLEEGK